MDEQVGPGTFHHHHVCYSPHCQTRFTPTGGSEDPLGFVQAGQGSCATCAVDARTCTGYTAVPGPGSPYHAEGFPSGHLPDHHTQLYAGSVQRDFVNQPVPWASLPPGWPDMPLPPPFASSYPSSQSVALSAPKTLAPINMQATTPNVNLVPIRLDKGSFIIAQTDYDCGRPLPTSPLSDPCAYGAFSLSNAMAKDFDDLFDPYEAAFPDVTFRKKISLRIRLVGCPQHDRQVAISCKHPTRAALATIVAKEIKRYIDRENANRRPLMIAHLRRALTVGDLCLVAIKHVSRASIQPVISLVAGL